LSDFLAFSGGIIFVFKSFQSTTTCVTFFCNCSKC
jgi:hypothetical protein